MTVAAPPIVLMSINRSIASGMRVSLQPPVSFCTAATVGAAPALTNAIFAATGFEFADSRVKDQLRSS
jgi:hypothetical protein